MIDLSRLHLLLLCLPVAVSACRATPSLPPPVITATATAGAGSAPAANPTQPPPTAAQTATASVASVAPPTPRATNTAVASATAEPSRETGVAIVDQVVEAAAQDEPEALRPLFFFATVSCTTADGLGGPPKCEDGQGDGTPVEVFPIWGPEGHYLQPGDLDGYLDNLQLGALYAVYRVPDSGQPALDYEPPGEYGVVFSGEVPAPPVTLLVDERGIVRAVYSFGKTPADVVEQAGGELLLEPLE